MLILDMVEKNGSRLESYRVKLRHISKVLFVQIFPVRRCYYLDWFLLYFIYRTKE